MSYNEPPPPSYGAPQPPYGAMPPKNSGMAVAGLVLGIIGVVPCFWGCFIFSILGIVFGQLGKKEIRESQGTKKGEGLAKWGVILGIAGIVLSVLYWILVATGVIDITYTNDFN